jgi:hypothetical protein
MKKSVLRGGYLLHKKVGYNVCITIGGRLMADWQKIKTEYITTDTSYRELSQKYGVHYTNIAKKAKKEDWQQLRQQQANTTQTKMIQAVERRKVDRAAKLLETSDLLLQKVRQRIEALDALEMGSQEFRHLSATIKDLKEIQMIRSDADMQKQAEKEDKEKPSITITLEGGLSDYAK